MECAAAGDHLPYVRENLLAAGSGNHDSAIGRVKAQSPADVDRRCGPSGEVVFRVEGEFDRGTADRRGDGAPHGWPGDAEVAVLVLKVLPKTHVLIPRHNRRAKMLVNRYQRNSEETAPV